MIPSQIFSALAEAIDDSFYLLDAFGTSVYLVHARNFKFKLKELAEKAKKEEEDSTCSVCGEILHEVYGTCLCVPSVKHGKWHLHCDPHKRELSTMGPLPYMFGESEEDKHGKKAAQSSVDDMEQYRKKVNELLNREFGDYSPEFGVSSSSFLANLADEIVSALKE